MKSHGINSTILQNRLLSQANSGTRSYNTSVGSVLNNSKGSNKKNSILGTGSSNKSLQDVQESKKNYTNMQSAAVSLKSHIGELQSIFGKNWEEMEEQDAAKYREKAETEISGLVEMYNKLVDHLSKESSTANSVYLKQLKDYVGGAKDALAGIGITQNKDGTLSLNKELLGKAEVADLQKVFGAESSFASRLYERAGNIIENAETNLTLLNKELYSGTYSYNKYGSDIYDLLFGSQYNTKG